MYWLLLLLVVLAELVRRLGREQGTRRRSCVTLLMLQLVVARRDVEVVVARGHVELVVAWRYVELVVTG